MSERTTGATPEQIKAAVTACVRGDLKGTRHHCESATQKWAAILVPPTARIVEDWAGVAESIRNILAEGVTYQCRQIDIDRLAALIGDES